MSLKATLKVGNKYVHKVAIFICTCCRGTINWITAPPINFYLPKKYSGFLFMHLMIRSVSVGHAWSFSCKERDVVLNAWRITLDR